MPTLEYARSFCGKTSRLYKDEDFEQINVMYDEVDGTLVCIVDFFRREEDDAEATFVFVKNPRGKWDVAPKHIQEIHQDFCDTPISKIIKKYPEIEKKTNLQNGAQVTSDKEELTRRSKRELREESKKKGE